MHPDISAVRDREDTVRIKLSRAVARVLGRAMHVLRSAISLLPRAAHWLRGQVGPPARLVRSLFLATIAKDRGFGFWWLVAMAAIALAIGLLVTVLLSPVFGIIAALIVGIWMLARRSRSSQSRGTARPSLAR
jgi:hypothetical protein